MDERVPADKIKYIHEEYLYKICKQSGFQGLTYYGGPKVFCKKCGNEIVLPFVEYKNGEKEVKEEQLRCVNRHAIAFDVNKILRVSLVIDQIIVLCKIIREDLYMN